MNKQQLANKIWESANKMRSKIEANEYKDYILGFIFYKYLSDTELKFLKKEKFSDEDIKSIKEEDEEVVKYIQEGIGYFISYENLFSTWLEKGRDFDVSNVRDALSAFNRLIYKTHSKVFDKIFDTLQTGLSKLGDSSNSQTKAISSLLELIKDIPMDGRQDYDVLGFIYEYLISQFAANAGKKAGEFYTPHEVSVLMSEIIAEHLKYKNEISIYDPTSGSGSLLINIGKSVSKYINDENRIKYYAQELKENTYNLTRMNLVMRGISPSNISTRNADTLKDDWPYFEDSDPINTYSTLHVDAVVSNPPYSQEWDSSDKENDPRYKFGIAPKSKADYAFLLHDLYHLKNDGIMTIVLPHGVLFRGGEEGVIRKKLLENSHIDTIIGLPSNIFFGTGIPTIIMVLRQKRENNDVLIIDASKGYIKDGKNNKLRACDIKKIVDTVIKRENIDKFSRVVNLDEIRNNDYNLNIPRYVDSSNSIESFDIYASMFGGIPLSEVDELNKYWEAFKTLKNKLFKDSSIPYVELVSTDIKQVIQSHKDIVEFEDLFKKSFIDFHSYLKKEWIENINSVDVVKSLNSVSDNMFERLNNISLINKYEAYQLLDNEWNKIVYDLEIIQTEGFDACRVVEPNLVIKKKDGKQKEVQEGWVGKILPFELVQTEILYKEYGLLKEKESRLSQIQSEYEEIFDSLSEEEKDSEVVNDSGDGFVLKEVSKKIKELRKEFSVESKEFLAKLERYEKLSDEEKELKKSIKEESDRLHILTKETIESLSDEKIYELLDKKWIVKLIDSINKLPDSVVNELVLKLEALSKKYEMTYHKIDEEIKQVEKELSLMIDELEGNEFDMKGLSEFKALLNGK